MTKIKQPKPIAWALLKAAENKMVFFESEPKHLSGLDGLITIHQAEAYKNACVADAIKDHQKKTKTVARKSTKRVVKNDQSKDA